MAHRHQINRKVLTLRREGTLNSHPEVIIDPLFQSHPFFDARDLLQVRYEMLRRHHREGHAITTTAAAFGVSRPTFYHAQRAFTANGLAGLFPKSTGPRDGHKLSTTILQYVRALQGTYPSLTRAECLRVITEHFHLRVHRRSLERALGRQKKVPPSNAEQRCQPKP